MADRTQWDIALHPDFDSMMEGFPITEEGQEAAANLMHVLRQCAGHLKEHLISGRPLRILRNNRTYLLANGKILPPVILFSELSEDGSKALVLAAVTQPTDPNLIVICGEEYEELVRQHTLEDSMVWK